MKIEQRLDSKRGQPIEAGSPNNDHAEEVSRQTRAGGEPFTPWQLSVILRHRD